MMRCIPLGRAFDAHGASTSSDIRWRPVRPPLTGSMRLAKHRKRKEHPPVDGCTVYQEEDVLAILRAIPLSPIRADLLMQLANAP